MSHNGLQCLTQFVYVLMGGEVSACDLHILSLYGCKHAGTDRDMSGSILTAAC